MSTHVKVVTPSRRLNIHHLLVVGVISLIGLYLTSQLLYAMEAERFSWSNLMSLIGGGILITVSYRLTFDWLSPAVILSSIWTFTLFLATFDVQFLGIYAVFNGEIFWSTWLVLVASVSAFIFGAMLATSFGKRSTKHTTQYNYDDKRARFVIYSSFTIAILGYGICYLTLGTAPILVDYLNEVRNDFRVSGYGLFMTLFMVTISLSAYMCGSTGILINWRLVLLGLVSYACMLSTTERADSFQTFVVGAITYLFARRGAIKSKTIKSSPLTSAAPLGLACVALTAAFLYVGSVRSSGDRGVAPTKIVDVESDLLAQLYIYSYVPSIKNLQWGTEQRIDHSYGLLVARPLLWISGRLKWIPEDIDFGGVNTVTWLWYYYRDFGYPGTVLIPLALGFGSTIVYRRAIQQPTVQSMTIYGLIVSCIIWTTGTERFFETMTFIYGVLLLVAGRFCQASISSQRPVVARG